MGLGRQFVEAVVREHRYRPIRGDVLMIGRQTVYFTPNNIMAFLQGHGIDTSAIDPGSIELDKSTIDRRPGFSDKALISDAALFKLLGVDRVLALDHSDYENADIIHDLRYPVPPDLHNRADLIIDGSTLDNVFTPSVVLENYCKMLRPGGRLLAVNAFSAHDTPYVIMPPLWYVDYFVMNGFSDCRVYVLVFLQNCLNVFYVDLGEIKSTERAMGRFVSPYHMATLVMAEKGSASSTDRLPIQQDYRSSEDWKIYRHNLAKMLQSKRPHLVRSNAEQFFDAPVRGHFYVDREFVAKS